MTKESDKEARNLEKLKNDKIFNNRYKFGEGHRDDEDYEHQTKIDVNNIYADNYLRDVYDYENTLEYNIGVSKIFELMGKEDYFNKILKKINKKEKIKLSKEEISELFNKILKLIHSYRSKNNFYSPIYVLEVVSSILSINSNDPIKDYKKIFDCLDVQVQEELILELDKKYNFLDGKMNRGDIH